MHLKDNVMSQSGTSSTARAFLLAAAVIASVAGVRAQAVAEATTPATAPTDEETIQLDPFTVSAAEDSGYSAQSTLAGTRVRTELKDVSSAISVVTGQFLRDTGSKNSQELLVYTPSTEIGGVRGNFSGAGGSGSFDENSNLLRPSNNTRVRGLEAADNTRDYFLTEIPWDGYNVGRVDLQRGPNSILFGVGSPAGIINTSLNGAEWNNKRTAESRLDNHGSVRFSTDVNCMVLKNELAIRIAALDDHTLYEQKPAYNHDRRLYGALRYDPKLFANGHTTIRVNYEAGDVKANRPRSLPPIDRVTQWFRPVGSPGSSVFGMGKLTADPTTTFNKYIKGASIFSNSFMGRLYATDVAMYYNADSSAATALSSAGFGTSSMVPYLNNVVVDSRNNVIIPSTSINGLLVGRYLSVPSVGGWATTAPAALSGGAYYGDTTINDPSIFNFYKNLLDGNNKQEWQKWTAENLNVSQTFLQDRVGFQYVYDRQRYKDGQYIFLNGSQYAIGIDINTKLIDGTTNPNLGRPYVGNSGTTGSGENFIDRDSHRLTAFGELRAADLMGKGWLSRLLGRHILTGLVSQDTKQSDNRGYLNYATDPSYAQATGQGGASLQTAARYVDWIAYLGKKSFMSDSSAAGANLPGITGTISPTGYTTIRYFNSQWNATGVDRAGAYTYTTYDATGAAVSTVGTQADNPANYVGWTNINNVRILNAQHGDLEDLYTGGTLNRNRIKSFGMTWQGYFWDDSVVATIGWRQDTVTNRSASAPVDDQGVARISYDLNSTPQLRAVGHSLSGGVVYHLKMLDQFLPAGTQISLLYNNAQNFKADAPRGDVFGYQIPNPTAKTIEYGVALSTLNDRLSFKVTNYRTREQNASLTGATGGGFAGNLYLFWAVPYWSATEGLAALEGIASPVSNGGLGYSIPNMPSSYVQNNQYSWQNIAVDSKGNPDGAAIFKSVHDFFTKFPLTQRFCDQYGIQMDVAKMHSSNVADWFAAIPASTPTNQNLGAQPLYGGRLKDFGASASATVDTESKGWEFESTAKLTHNWDLTLNVTKTNAVRNALNPTMDEAMKIMTDFLATDAGNIRWWGGPTFRDQWNNNLVASYKALKAQQGTSAAEVPEWRSNLISTYRFNHGLLNRLYVGGAFRWEDHRVLGYQYSAAMGTIDVSKPWYGPTDSHVDMWVGRTWDLPHKMSLRMQFNVRNLGENDRLVPVSVQPDGSVAISRIQEGALYQLTTTLSF